MYSLIRQAIQLRKRNPPDANEYLLIDALLESDFSEEVKLSNAVTYMVGGFHTTGLCVYFKNIPVYQTGVGK